MSKQRHRKASSSSTRRCLTAALAIAALCAAAGVGFNVLVNGDDAHATTGGSGGPMTDRTNLSFSNGTYTSTYHLYAAGLDTSKALGMMMYADGSGEYGLKNPQGSYLLGGSNGLINVAKRNNMVLVTPLSPNKSCSDGDGSCWYMGDSPGYTKWAEDLVLSIQKQYNIDTDRVAMGGYSSGAQLATQWWVPSGAAQRTMTDGVIVAISFGGKPQVDDTTSAAFKQKVHLSWDVGSSDPSYTGSGSYGVHGGHDYYKGKGFDTSLNVVSGDHDRSGQFGAIMDREIKAHVPAGSTPTSPSTPTTSQPAEQPSAEPTSVGPIQPSLPLSPSPLKPDSQSALASQTATDQAPAPVDPASPVEGGDSGAQPAPPSSGTLQESDDWAEGLVPGAKGQTSADNTSSATPEAGTTSPGGSATGTTAATQPASSSAGTASDSGQSSGSGRSGDNSSGHRRHRDNDRDCDR